MIQKNTNEMVILGINILQIQTCIVFAKYLALNASVIIVICITIITLALKVIFPEGYLWVPLWLPEDVVTLKKVGFDLEKGRRF